MLKQVLQIIFKNFWYKLGSVVLAVLVWGIVQGEEIVEINQRIKVYISTAPGYAVRGQPYKYIEATIKGPRVLLGDDMVSGELEATVFVPSNEPGQIELPFDRSSIKNLDSRLKLTVRDSYINVFVDEKVTKEVDIREVLVGAPAEGFFIEEVVIEPARVKLTGIRADVIKVDGIPTEPIDISRLNQSKSFEVGLMPGNFPANALSTDGVKVKIRLGDSKINSRFTSIPVEVVGSEYEAEVRPKDVAIVIQGTPGVLSFVTKDDLRAFVEVTNMGPGRYEREIQVKIPPDTVLIETFPKKGVVEINNQKRIN